MKKNLRYIISIVYLIIAATLLVFVFQNNYKKDNLDLVKKPTQQNQTIEIEEQRSSDLGKKQEQQPKQDIKKSSATIAVDNLTFKVDFVEGVSLYDVLIEENKKGNLHIAGKEFSGMGFFVSEIGPLKEQADKHLIYFINGKSPNVGISSYILKNGDVVKWELK